MTVAEKNQHKILRILNTLIWIFEWVYILDHAQFTRIWIWWLGIHRAGRFAFLFRLTTIAIWNCIKITSWLRFTFTFRTDWIESHSYLNPPMVIFNAMTALENTCFFDVNFANMQLFDGKGHSWNKYKFQQISTCLTLIMAAPRLQ